jgi:hypothetical protein
MNREANAVSVNLREFARDNKINTHVLCGFIKEDNSITASFVRRNVNYYKLNVITSWFMNNRYKFKPNKLHNDYFCKSCRIHTTIDRKSTRYSCCVGCEKKADARTTPEAIASEAAINVVAIDTSSRRGIAAIMEKRALDDVINDNWMND